MSQYDFDATYNGYPTDYDYATVLDYVTTVTDYSYSDESE